MGMMIQSGRFSSAPLATGTTLDPSETDALVTLSNGDLTATKAATNSTAHCVAKHGKITGKWRYQVTVDALPMSGGELGVGCIGPLYDRLSFQGNSTESCGFVQDGRQGTNGSFSASGLGAWATSDILDVYVDADAMLMWFGKNGTVSGDPTAGTGGVSVGSLTKAFFPNLYMHGGDGQLTANFGGPFTHSLHPAFLPWSDVQTCDRDTFRAAMIYIRSVGFYAHCIGELSVSAASAGTNLLLGGTATAAGVSSGQVAANAFDGAPLTWWEHTVSGGSDQGPSWIASDIGAHAARAARFLALQARSGTGGEELQAPTLFDLYFSSDAVSWEKGAIGITLPAFAPNIPGIIHEVAIPAL